LSADFEIPTEFDTFTLGILRAGPNPPDVTEEEANAMQMRHLAHIFGLKREGKIFAAGPMRSEADPLVRGLGIYPGDIDAARANGDADPAVQAGVYVIEYLTWTTPAGGLSFAPTPPDGGR
jgi:uncharacterized protein